jgi:uncharacterized membrane protein YdjX (TVP38/TMEM64 family)
MALEVPAHGDMVSARTPKLLLAAAVVAVIVIAGTLLLREVPESVSAPLFLLVVIIEVVIAPIPGGAVGYLGAARFGFWEAWPLLYVGNIIGTILVFFLARRIGTPIFKENASSRTRARYDRVLEHHPVLLWFAYSVPLLPVDVLSALAGLSTISARRFFLIALSGYFFYTAIIAYVGSSLAQYIGVADAMGVIGVVFFVGLGWWLWPRRRK